MKRKLSFVKALSLVMLFSILITGCSPRELQQVRKDEFILGTFGQITIFAPSARKGEQALEKAFKHVRTIENMMSTSIEGSDIQQLNQKAGEGPVVVNGPTLEVIQKGLEYFDTTQGSFNIVLGSLIELWGIGKDWQKVPTPEEINEAKNHIDIRQIEISPDNKTVFLKDSKMLMDLGGIAKGYSVDEAVRILKENGINSGFVNLGGDIYALGTKADGTPWNIGIQDPDPGSNDVIASVPIVDKSIVTSGDYERYFEENGARYHHILDPSTGYPADSGLSSVTIISEKSIDGDVLSTAVFILGLEKGLQLIESLPGIEGVLITKDKGMYPTSGIANEIKLLDNSFTIH